MTYDEFLNGLWDQATYGLFDLDYPQERREYDRFQDWLERRWELYELDEDGKVSEELYGAVMDDWRWEKD